VESHRDLESDVALNFSHALIAAVEFVVGGLLLRALIGRQSRSTAYPY
jgi:hypothetical protein